MYFAKKAYVLFIIIILVVTSSLAAYAYAPADREYITRAQAVEEIVKVLYNSCYAGGADVSDGTGGTGVSDGTGGTGVSDGTGGAGASDGADGTDGDGFMFEYFYCMHPRKGGAYVHFVYDDEIDLVGYPIYCELFQSVESGGFSDLPDDLDDQSVYITLAKGMGIIDGYDDNTFRPDDYITYNEAAKICVRAFSLRGSAQSYAYPGEYIDSALNMGVISDFGVISEDIINADAGLRGDDLISSRDFYETLHRAIDNGYARNYLGALTPLVTKEYIPVHSTEYNPDDYAYTQISQASTVSVDGAEILSMSELSDELTVCWYLDDGVQKCAYRRRGGDRNTQSDGAYTHSGGSDTQSGGSDTLSGDRNTQGDGADTHSEDYDTLSGGSDTLSENYDTLSGDWICFLAEDSGYRNGYGATLYGDLFGHNGFSIQAPRGVAYYANDYYYFDDDGKLRFLFNETYLDIPLDLNGDGVNELLWFYHGGRDASLFYSDGDDIYAFDIIETLSERFHEWDDITIDPLSLDGFNMRISYRLKSDPEGKPRETLLIMGYESLVVLTAK